MSSDLDKLREIFLSEDLDEETRADNQEKILEWEQSLFRNESFAGWQEHDVSKALIRQARDSYLEFSLALVRNRSLTEAQRLSLYAKQDACMFLLSLIETDAKGTLDQIQREIKTALSSY